MDPHPPFDHQHYRRALPGHHYPDQHSHHYADQHLAGGVGGGAAPALSRYDYEFHPIQYLPSDHQDHLPRIHHQPPPPLPPPPPHHRHDAPLPLRAPPETYSPPQYHSLSPHHPYHPQRHACDDFRAADEICRVPSRHHHMQEHHHHHREPQLPWEEAEEERRRYATLQPRLSPPDSRKRHRCPLHGAGDLENTSSSGPPPRRQRQHQHSSCSLDDKFVYRTASHPGYSRHEGFITHSDSKGNRKMQTSTSTMLPDSPHKIDAGYPRCAPQKSTPARMSVWQRIEENPSFYTPSSPRQLPKELRISPSKTKNAGSASKELASEISLDCKAISPSKTKSTGSASKELASVISLDHEVKSVDCKGLSDNGGTKKSTGKKSEKVLASVLAKPSPESKEKEMAVKQDTRKLNKVQNNVPGFSNGITGLSARCGTGVKKVKKIVIKKIVRKIGASDKQTSRSVIPEQKNDGDANANACEKEEGEITMSSFEKEDRSASAHNLISTSDTVGVGNSMVAEKEQNDCLINPCKDVHKKEGSEMCVASLGDSIGTPKIAEPSMTQDAQKEEGNMLTSPRDKGIVSVSSGGTLNSMELSVSEEIQDKNGRIPMEPSEDNASVTHHVNARDRLKASFNEDIQEKECIMSNELREAATSVTKSMEFSMNENIQKNESRISIDSDASKTTQHLEASNRAEVFTNKVVGSEVCRSHMDSDEPQVDTLDNSIDAPDFVLAGGTEDSRTQELFHDQRITLDKSHWHQEAADMDFSNFPLAKNVESSIMLLDRNPIGKDTISQAAELMHLHRADLSTANDLLLLHSRDSPSVSDNSEHSLPTALTLGNNTYFSSAESEQLEENNKLMESSKGVDDVTATEFGKIENGKSESGDGLIKADGQNWLTLPLAGNYVNNDATINMDRFDLEQNVDERTSVSQDHGTVPDMHQYGSIDAFDGQDHSLKLSCSNVSQSDLLVLKERNKNIENGGEIVLLESSVCSVNSLDQYGYRTIDKPIDNTNKPVILSSQSAGVTGVELASSQVCDDSGHTYHNNTMDPVVELSTMPDMISSWMEAIVSEATKEHQPCKSTPDTHFGLKEDTRKALPDPLINSALKSPSRMNSTSSTAPKVPTKPTALPSSSSEALRLNQNARHMTWHRDNVSYGKSYLHASQSSGLPPKQPLRKNGKTQNCYIRKGNALIRNPATGNHPQFSSSALDAPSKLSKPIMRRSMNFVRKVDSNDTVAYSNISVERPKTPPLALHTKSFAMNISEPFSQSLQKQQVPETEKEDSSGQVNSGIDNPSVQKSEPLDAGKVVYVRPKSNQLVDSQGQQSGDSISSLIDKVPLLQPSTTSDLYFKKRKNQIVLDSSPSDVSSSKEMSQAENSNTGEAKVLMFASTNKKFTVAKDGPHKALRTTNTVGSFSHVWTLSGQHPQRKHFVGTNHVKAFPRILPWKRKVFSHNYSNYSSLLNTSSLGIVRKLLKTRKRGTLYTVSTNGFSLRKSGLLSFDGSSLKWSRSLEKRSQKVNEEATLAVAEIDRKKRERRKSLRNKGRNDQYSIPVEARNNHHTSSDSRVPSTCNEYVRINKGNQLVRNPKKVLRMLASEKVRWSLHTVRTRLAKKQQYCQFFTRFGECKKSGGKCPYIHDRAKVAICTKFLKGLCSNASCKLTHKVLPERMPDCSYFLRGLCSNTTCPYRHVKVNMNAPVCEDFLKGYCAGGDECRKRHSYVCPVFEATWECPQQSRCKLHHPKKKIKSKRTRVDSLQNNSWGRYFDSSISEGSEAMRVYSEEDKQNPEHAIGGNLADFIDLGSDIDGSVDVDASDDINLMELDSRNLKMQVDNLDALTKPLRIMRTARV